MKIQSRPLLPVLLAAILFVPALPAAAATEPGFSDIPTTPKGWLGLAQARQSQRLTMVSNYVEKIKGGGVPGLELMGDEAGRCTGNCRVYTTVDLVLPDGSTLKAGHLLSPTEVAVLAGTAPNANNMAMFGLGMGMAQDMLAQNAHQMLGPWAPVAEAVFGDISVSTAEVAESIRTRSWEGEAEINVGVDESGEPVAQTMKKDWEAPWLNPFRLYGAGSMMFLEGSIAVTEAELSLGESGNQALAEAVRLRDEVEDAELAGYENIDGEDAMKIDFPNIGGGGGKLPTSEPEPFGGLSSNAFQASGAAANDGAGANEPVEIFGGDASFIPQRMSVWIRPGEYVIVKHRVDGIASADGQTREFYIENTMSDFRYVPGSEMYEPYRRTMSMGGILDDKQMAELQEARKQLEDFDKQLAAMSPQERQMVEEMMGDKMDALRGMAETGAFVMVEVIDEIIVNADLKSLYGPPQGGFQPPSPEDLLQRIQADLRTLGYRPGNTVGKLDTMTTVAISQYQAERGFSVTGEPSKQLANALAADVDDL